MSFIRLMLTEQTTQSVNYERIVSELGMQATEPASLIPLLCNCEAAVLVGDPCQLPPTVISTRVSFPYLQSICFTQSKPGLSDKVVLRSNAVFSALMCTCCGT
jgi:hypothetical protein